MRPRFQELTTHAFVGALQLLAGHRVSHNEELRMSGMGERYLRKLLNTECTVNKAK